MVSEMTPGQVITSYKFICQLHFPKNSVIFVAVLSELRRPHDALVFAFGSLSDRNDQSMDMRIAIFENRNLQLNSVPIYIRNWTASYFAVHTFR